MRTVLRLGSPRHIKGPSMSNSSGGALPSTMSCLGHAVGCPGVWLASLAKVCIGNKQFRSPWACSCLSGITWLVTLAPGPALLAA